MLSKKDIQYIRSLGIKKYRQKYHKYLAEGEKICLEILDSAFPDLVKIYGTQEFVEDNRLKLKERGVDFEIVTQVELQKISQLKSPNRVLGILNFNNELSSFPQNLGDKVFYLDGINDPGNLGTIIRSAEWFGIDTLIISPDSVDPYNPKVVQAAMGSLFRQDIRILEFDNFIEHARTKGFQLFSAEMDGRNAFDVKFNLPCAIIMGNESHGVSIDIGDLGGQKITIPRFNTKTESLNVGIAASVLMAGLNK